MQSSCSSFMEQVFGRLLDLLFDLESSLALSRCQGQEFSILLVPDTKLSQILIYICNCTIKYGIKSLDILQWLHEIRCFMTGLICAWLDGHVLPLLPLISLLTPTHIYFSDSASVRDKIDILYKVTYMLYIIMITNNYFIQWMSLRKRNLFINFWYLYKLLKIVIHFFQLKILK